MELSRELQRELSAAIATGEEGAAFCVALSVASEAGMDDAATRQLANDALARVRNNNILELERCDGI